MAQPVYSVRLFATGALTSASGTVGPVVPSGLVYVLRDIDVVEITGTASAAMQVYGQTGGILWVYERGSTLNSAWGGWRGRQVYNEGEQIGFSAPSGTWSISASGYQLTLP